MWAPFSLLLPVGRADWGRAGGGGPFCNLCCLWPGWGWSLSTLHAVVYCSSSSLEGKALCSGRLVAEGLCQGVCDVL